MINNLICGQTDVVELFELLLFGLSSREPIQIDTYNECLTISDAQTRTEYLAYRALTQVEAQVKVGRR